MHKTVIETLVKLCLYCPWPPPPLPPPSGRKTMSGYHQHFLLSDKLRSSCQTPCTSSLLINSARLNSQDFLVYLTLENSLITAFSSLYFIGAAANRSLLLSAETKTTRWKVKTNIKESRDFIDFANFGGLQKYLFFSWLSTFSAESKLSMGAGQHWGTS